MPKNNIDELMSIALNTWTQAEMPVLNQAIGAEIQQAQQLTLPDKTSVEAELRTVRNLLETPVRRTDVSALAELRASTRTPVLPTSVTESRSSSASQSTASSDTGKTILKVAGMVKGLGPLITSLVGLFGSGNDQPVAAPTPYTAPDQVHVEAGLDSRRTFTSISYGQDGVARNATQTETAQPRVEIHVNAMDSRSFLDHSDEIARAVQSAMLRSHSINDVVADL